MIGCQTGGCSALQYSGRIVDRKIVDNVWNTILQLCSNDPVLKERQPHLIRRRCLGWRLAAWRTKKPRLMRILRKEEPQKVH